MNTCKIITILLVFSSVNCLAQEIEGPLTMKRSIIMMDGRIVKPREVLKIMEPYNEAYQSYRKAKANYDAAQFFSFTGGFLVGWPLGTAIAGGDPNWGMAGAGAGLILIGIPFTSAYKKHASNAIRIYNGGTDSQTASAYDVYFTAFPGGARLTLKL